MRLHTLAVFLFACAVPVCGASDGLVPKNRNFNLTESPVAFDAKGTPATSTLVRDSRNQLPKTNMVVVQQSQPRGPVVVTREDSRCYTMRSHWFARLKNREGYRYLGQTNCTPSTQFQLRTR